MNEEKKTPVIGEMISQFPVEELRRMIINVDRFDVHVKTPESELRFLESEADDLEEKMEEVSEKIIEENL